MPSVGGKKFSYTPAGKKAAIRHSKKTGQSVKSAYKKGGRVKMAQGGYSSFGAAKGFDYAGPWVNSDGYPTGGIDVKD
tara:strand:+ start:600 stop:833 length:234 start_codon:yes stop_codon:yes gene_type:complete